MTRAELSTELTALRATVQAAVAKARGGKNTKEYVAARKNIARVLTALAALPAEITGSTEAKK